MLTIDQIKGYWISKNTSRINNLVPSLKSVAVYNDSINLYDAIEFVINETGIVTGTDLGASQSTTQVSLTSSTGSGTTILAADATRSGVMTSDMFTSLTNLGTLVGVSGSDLGTFTGTIITDNTTIKNALQELETYTETINTSIDGLPELITLSGVAINSSDLGTFTGITISDNNTIKGALQELETSLESVILAGGADGNGIYDGNGTVPASTTATLAGAFAIDTTGETGYTIRLGGITGATPNRYGISMTHNTVTIGNVFGTTGQPTILVNSSNARMDTAGAGIIVGNSGDITVYYLHNDGMTFNRLAGTGTLQYGGDYSTDYTIRSLVDKGYVDVIEAKIDDVITLSGVATNSTDLGTFTGVTIPDNSTIKQALQALETDLELVSGGGSGNTNLDTTYTTTSFTVTSDTGSNAIVNAATDLLAGAMTAADKTNLDALVILTGVTGGNEDLGTFTGVTISDNVTIKTALQELETAVDNFSAASGLPSGTNSQTVRYNNTTMEASSVILNDGATVSINAALDASYDLVIGGPIKTTAGLVSITGNGDPSSTLSAASLRLINDTPSTGETFNLGVTDSGNFGIYVSATPAIAVDVTNKVGINGASLSGMLNVKSDTSAPSTSPTATLQYYPGGGVAMLRFLNESNVVLGDIHAEGGNLEIETPSIFTITAGTEGYNFNGVGNLVFPNQVSDPGSPAEGSIWYNSTDNRFKVQDDLGVESVAFISDIPKSAAGTYSLEDSTVSYTVGTDNTVYLRANTASMTVTLGPNMVEGEIYYLYAKAWDPYIITLEIPTGHTWWMVGNINEDLTDATHITVDYTDRNSFFVAQRRGTRIFIRSDQF